MAAHLHQHTCPWDTGTNNTCYHMYDMAGRTRTRPAHIHTTQRKNAGIARGNLQTVPADRSATRPHAHGHAFWTAVPFIALRQLCTSAYIVERGRRQHGVRALSSSQPHQARGTQPAGTVRGLHAYLDRLQRHAYLPTPHVGLPSAYGFAFARASSPSFAPFFAHATVATGTLPWQLSAPPHLHFLRRRRFP